MSILDLPRFAFYGGVRYESHGDEMRKQIGPTSFPWGIPKAPAQPALAAGGGGSMLAGVYKVFCVGETATGYKGMPYTNTPQSVTVTDATEGSIAVTDIPVFGSPEIAYVGLYRTSIDALAPFYFAGRVLNGVRTLTLNGADESLDTNDALEPPESIMDDEGAWAGPFRYTKPPIKEHCFTWDGRIFILGERAIRPGFVSAEDGETEMVASGGMKSSYEGMTIILEGEKTGYHITRVLSSTIFTVEQEYRIPSWRGGVDPVNVAFRILGSPWGVNWSETDAPNYYPWTNEMPVGQEEGGLPNFGCSHMGDALIFSDTDIYHMYRTDSAVTPYAIRKTMSEVGCGAPRSVLYDGPYVYFFSGEHFYRFSNNKSERMDYDLGDWPGTLKHSVKKYIIGSQIGHHIYWAVPIDPLYDPYSRDYLNEIWVYDTARQAWQAPIKDLRIVDMEAITTYDGTRKLWIEIIAGTQIAGRGYALHEFDEIWKNDGLGDRDHTGGGSGGLYQHYYWVEPIVQADFSGTVTSAGAITLTDSAAAFPTDDLGLKGVQVAIWEGTGIGQKRWIDSNTATTLSLNQVWITIPDTTSKYTIGAIDDQRISGHIDMGRPHDEQTVMYVEMGFKGERDE